MLPAILAATFMTLFDFFVVNVAAPSLQHDLHAGQSALELVVGGYAFTYASGMVTGGRLGDQLGHRRVFLVGISAFGVASLLCGLAQSPWELVAARLVQGLTGALMVPQVLALITATFPAAERPRAMSWFGVTMSVGAVAGQILGGVLLQADVLGLGWRVIFLINVPVSALALVAAAKLLPRNAPVRTARFDLLGAAGVSAALALLLVPLILGRERHWAGWIWAMMVLSVPVFAATLVWERRLGRARREPILDLTLFAAPTFAAGLPANAAFMGYFGSFQLVLTLLLQGGLGLSPLDAGLTFAPMGVLFALASVLGRPLAMKLGALAVTAGSLVVGAGLAILIVELHVLGRDITVAWLILATAVIGVGSGIAFPALVGSVLIGVPPTSAGAAAGVLTTTQQFASAAGVAAFGAVFFAMLGTGGSRADYASATEVFALLDLTCVLVAALLAVFVRRTGTVVRPAPAT